jgi:hypothetical protein
LDSPPSQMKKKKRNIVLQAVRAITLNQKILRRKIQ